MNPDLTQKQADDFWAQVHVGGPDDCWIWRGRVTIGAIGIYIHDGYRYYAHNVAYTLSTSVDVPMEHPLRRSCKYVSCCNPAHILLD